MWNSFLLHWPAYQVWISHSVWSVTLWMASQKVLQLNKMHSCIASVYASNCLWWSPLPHTHTYTYARVHTPPPPPPTHWHHQLFSSTSFQSLIYLSQSWSVPSARLWVGGALGMTQRVPFPSSGRVTSFNSSLLDTGGLVVEDFEIRNILSAYNRRNGRRSTTCWGWVSNIPQQLAWKFKVTGWLVWILHSWRLPVNENCDRPWNHYQVLGLLIFGRSVLEPGSPQPFMEK